MNQLKPAKVTDNVNYDNVDYWTKREDALDKADLKQDAAFEKELLKTYKKYNNEIKKEINQYYKDFAEANNITTAQAKKLLSTTELGDFMQNMQLHTDQMIKNGVDPEIIKHYQDYTQRLRISKLESIAIQINAQTEILKAQVKDQMEEYLTQAIKESFYQQAWILDTGTGVNISYSGINEKELEKILNLKWVEGKNWLVSLNEQDLKLKKELFDTLYQGTILGWSENKMIEELMSKININYQRAQVNIRTNKNFVRNQAFKEAYNQAGFTKYKFLAMHPRGQHPHKLCTELNNTIHELKDAKIGINYPPISYNCRSTTAPVLDEASLENLKKNTQEKVDKDMSYEDWLKKYYPTTYYEMYGRKK